MTLHTMVSMRAVLGTCGTAIAGFVMPIAVFVQDAVVMSLLEGVPSKMINGCMSQDTPYAPL